MFHKGRKIIRSQIAEKSLIKEERKGFIFILQVRYHDHICVFNDTHFEPVLDGQIDYPDFYRYFLHVKVKITSHPCTITDLYCHPVILSTLYKHCSYMYVYRKIIQESNKQEKKNSNSL
jgi:hypothetical protein